MSENSKIVEAILNKINDGDVSMVDQNWHQWANEWSENIPEMNACFKVSKRFKKKLFQRTGGLCAFNFFVTICNVTLTPLFTHIKFDLHVLHVVTKVCLS